MKSKFSLIFLVLCMSASLLIGTTIYDIQYTTIAGDGTYPSLLVGQTVTVTGIVSAASVAGYDDNFFITSAAGGAWNGVYVYYASTDVSEGDEVEVTGEVQEYNGYTEIGYATEVNILSTANPVPQANAVSTSDLTTAATGEP